MVQNKDFLHSAKITLRLQLIFESYVLYFEFLFPVVKLRKSPGSKQTLALTLCMALLYGRQEGVKKLVGRGMQLTSLPLQP